MKSSIFQKMTRKIWRISALCTIKTLRAEILQIFGVIFWKIDDFINSFWLNLTFSPHLRFCFIKRFHCKTLLERLCLAALWDNGVRYLFIQPFSCVSPVSCWHWDDVNTIRWSLFFAKDNKQTAIASNFWMKNLCNVKPKIKIQDYETTTIIMLSNMRIKFNKKKAMGNLAPALLLNRYFTSPFTGCWGLVFMIV